MRFTSALIQPSWLLAALVLLPSTAGAQTRMWANSANGLWMDATRWSPADVPDGPDENAVFDVFGTYAVTLLDGDPSIVLDGFRVDRGVVTLRADGVGDATVRVGGNAVVGGELRLADIASTHVDLGVAGELSLLSGARLLVDGGPLFASSTSLQGGSLTANTTVVLDNGAFAELGAVSVAASGDSLSRAGIDLFNGSLAPVDDLRIATESAGTVGEVVLDNSQLLQTSGSSTIVGRSRVEGSVGRGALAVANGGSLTLGSLTINDTGSVVNDSSTVTLGGTLDIAGGSYLERDLIQRDTTEVDRFLIRDGGEATLTTEPLTVAVGQQLRMDLGTLTSGAGLVIEGSMRVGSGEISTVAGPTTLGSGTLTIEPDSEVRFLDRFEDQGGFLDIHAGGRVVFASDYFGFGSVGTGSIEFAAASSAGNSVGLSEFGGDLSWGNNAQFVAELAGATPGTFDRVTTNGTANIAGELVVEMLDNSGFTPAEGDAFTLLTATTITGNFGQLTLPDLTNGLDWRVVRTPRRLTLRVVAPSTPGDFNNDGVIDAADYTVWRDTTGSTGPLLAADANGDELVNEADLAIWRSAYGVATAISVPEPSTLLLAPAACSAVMACRQRS